MNRSRTQTQHNATDRNTTQRITTQRNATQHNGSEHNATQHNTAEQNSPQHNKTGKKNRAHLQNKPVEVTLSSTKHSAKNGQKTLQVKF